MNLSQVNQKYINQIKYNTKQANNTAAQTNSRPTDNLKINKKKMLVSTAAGIGIGAIVIGGLLYGKKISFKNSIKLPAHIEFENCDTLEKAIEFGKNKLGISKYIGFAENDTDVVNWINEGLVYINNAAKGKAKMPKNIAYMKFKEDRANLITAASMNSVGTLSINKNYINNIKNDIKKMLLDISDKYKFTIKKIEKKKNFKEYINLQIKFTNKAKNKLNEQANAVKFNYNSTFATISHEMGHYQHVINTNTCLPDLDDMYKDLIKDNIDVVRSVSGYAATSPIEFVAECYSMMIDEKMTGKKLLSDEARRLYLKMGGVTY